MISKIKFPSLLYEKISNPVYSLKIDSVINTCKHKIQIKIKKKNYFTKFLLKYNQIQIFYMLHIYPRLHNINHFVYNTLIDLLYYMQHSQPYYVAMEIARKTDSIFDTNLRDWFHLLIFVIVFLWNAYFSNTKKYHARKSNLISGNSSA